MHDLKTVIGNGDRLDSWKAIAEYLGRDRTTVMRWERTAGLPVRRVTGTRGSVFAYKADVDRWLANRGASDARAASPVPEAERSFAASRIAFRPRVRLWAVAGALVLVAAGAAGYQIWSASPDIASASISGEQIVAVDASGREAWRYTLPHVDGAIIPTRIAVTDIDDDGRRDVVAALHFINPGGRSYGSVMLFDHRGRLRWERSLDDRYTFGNTEYGPVWFPDDLVVYRSHGAARIAVAQHHHLWWPSVVVTYDGNGVPLDRFVNAGWIRSLNVTADGRYLLAAGISNSFGGAMLAVLDASRPSGTSPQAGSTLPPCANCPAGSPLAYFLAPWSDLARPSETPAVVVHVGQTGVIEWHAVQRGVEQGLVPDVIVSLSPGLELLHREVNDYFAETYARLARTGQMQGAAAAWRPTVRQWTAARGWHEL